VVDETYDPIQELSSGTLDERRTKRLIEEILVANDRLFWKIAHRYSQFYSAGPYHDKDDVIQIVRQVAWETLVQISEGHGRSDLAWEAIVNVRSRGAVRDYIISSAATGIPGSGARTRRRQALAQHADYLSETTGREVKGKELLDDYNQTAKNTPNAVKRGIFATATDLQPTATVLAQLFPHQTENMSKNMEMVDLIRSVLDICRDHEDPDLFRVAELWLGWYPDGEPLTYAKIAIECQLSPTRVSRLLDVARDIFRSQF
jgi:hypothetical protein